MNTPPYLKFRFCTTVEEGYVPIGDGFFAQLKTGGRHIYCLKIGAAKRSNQVKGPYLSFLESLRDTGFFGKGYIFCFVSHSRNGYTAS
jgi:hypothetical protein